MLNSEPGRPFVSVIVPVLDGERTIGDCLASLLKMDYPAERREIVVVDNGSVDRTADVVGRNPVRYLWEKRRGISYARNRGIEASRGDILAFTDADCVVTTGWLSQLVLGFEGGEIGGVEGETLVYLPITPTQRYMASRNPHSYRARRYSPLSPYVGGANAAFRREVFTRIGLFDPRFQGGEDVDFTWRFFQESGLKLRYNPRAVVFHRERSTVRSFFSQQIRNGRGLANLRAKYPERLPWSMWQELRAWGAVAALAGLATQTAVRSALQGAEKMGMDVYHPYLTFVRRLGIRIGFVMGNLARDGRR